MVRAWPTTRKPELSASTSSIEAPSPSAWRAITIANAAPSAPVMRCFSPETTQPPVTLRAEMTMWSEVRHWSPRNRAGLVRFLSGFVHLPYDEDVAVGWGRVQGAAVLHSRKRPANDTWVAAVWLAHGLPLATRNVRDFQDFADHNGLVLVTE